MALRGEGRSLQEIGRLLEAAGAGLSRTAIWEILAEAGLGRLAPAEDEPTAPAAAKTRRLRDADRPRIGTIQSELAGLFLLLPELVELDLPGLAAAAGYPGTSQLGALNSLLALLALSSTSVGDTIFRHLVATPGDLRVTNDSIEGEQPPTPPQLPARLTHHDPNHSRVERVHRQSRLVVEPATFAGQRYRPHH